MAQASSSDFTDDFKNQLKAILVGSFAYGSVFPLVIRAFSTVTSTTSSTQSSIFKIINIIYFIVPLLIGAIIWFFFRKTDDNDLLFKQEGLPLFRINTKKERLIKNVPTIILSLLFLVGLFVIIKPYHGPELIWSLMIAYLYITFGFFLCCFFLYKKLARPPLKNVKIYFKRAATRIWLQACIGIFISSVLFFLSIPSFFYQHEGIKFWKEDALSQEDSLLTIEMPFEWEETATKVNSLLVKPFNNAFTTISNEASILAANQVDYNDITIRISPTYEQQQLINQTLPLKAADSLRIQLITAHLLEKHLIIDKKFAGPDALDTLIQKINDSQQVGELIKCYSLLLDSLKVIRTNADTLFTPTMQLFRANQLMPLADNLAEASDILRLMADEQSRTLLAEWINISRIKGYFFLSIFLNLLLFAWLIIRLTNEAFIRSIDNSKSTDSPKQFRELVTIRYFITIVILLIIPLYRTVDANTVNANQPYWFLNLPELVNNVVQPLPNSNRNTNYGQNEITSRLDQINEKINSLNNVAKKLEKVSKNTRSDLHDMKY